MSKTQEPVQVIPKNMLTLCQLIGYFPLKYAKNGTSIKFSKPIFWWNTTCLTVVTAFIWLVLYLDVTGYLKGQFVRMTSSTHAVVIFIDTVPNNILSVVTLISTSKYYSKYIEMSLLLIKFDNKFHRETQQVLFKKKTFITFIIITVLISGSVINLISKNKLNVLYIIPFTTYYTEAACFIHFTYLVESITARFSVINNQMREELVRQVRSNSDQSLTSGKPLFLTW